MKATRTLLTLGLSIASIAAADAQQANPRYSSLTVFGDSLVDAGNIAIFTGNKTPNPAVGYFQGRFTNGYDYTDLLSIDLYGKPTLASLAGGTNFAFGGARATTTSSVPDLFEQLAIFNDYLAAGNKVDPTGLYVLNFGGNDIFNAPTTGTSAFLKGAAANYAQGVQTLVDRGARNLLITGFPVPNALSVEAEGYLTTSLAGLSLTSDTTLYRYNVLDFYGRVQAAPASLGLPTQNFATTCIAAQAQATGCAGIFSFDGTHPTAPIQAALYRDLNRQFNLTGAVPEPATWAMMIAGFAMVGAAMRRRVRVRYAAA